MKPLLFLLCVVFLLVSSVTSAFAQSQPVSVGFSHWPPYIDKDHIAMGVVPEIIHLCFLTQNIDVNFVVFENWSDCYGALLDGKIDSSAPYTPTKKRKNEVHFSKRPIIELKTTLFYLREKAAKMPKANIFRNQNAFAKYTIGGTKGYFYQDLFKDLNMVYAPGTRSNFLKLFLGKVDIVIENELVGWYSISKLFPYSMSQFGVIPESNETHGGHLIVRKGSETGLSTLRAFEKGLEILQQNGTYAEVIRKYKKSFKRLF